MPACAVEAVHPGPRRHAHNRCCLATRLARRAHPPLHTPPDPDHAPANGPLALGLHGTASCGPALTRARSRVGGQHPLARGAARATCHAMHRCSMHHGRRCRAWADSTRPRATPRVLDRVLIACACMCIVAAGGARGRTAPAYALRRACPRSCRTSYVLHRIASLPLHASWRRARAWPMDGWCGVAYPAATHAPSPLRHPLHGSMGHHARYRMIIRT